MDTFKRTIKKLMLTQADFQIAQVLYTQKIAIGRSELVKFHFIPWFLVFVSLWRKKKSLKLIPPSLFLSMFEKET